MKSRSSRDCAHAIPSQLRSWPPSAPGRLSLSSRLPSPKAPVRRRCPPVPARRSSPARSKAVASGWSCWSITSQVAGRGGRAGRGDARHDARFDFAVRPRPRSPVTGRGRGPTDRPRRGRTVKSYRASRRALMTRYRDACRRRAFVIDARHTRSLTWRSGRGRGHRPRPRPRTDRPTAPQPRQRLNRHVRPRVMPCVDDVL